MKKLALVAAVLSVAVSQTGCATIFSGTSTRVKIDCDHPKASVVVIGGGAASMILKAQKIAGLADRIIDKLSPHVPQDSMDELRKHSLEEMVGIIALSLTSPMSMMFLSEKTRDAIAKIPKPVRDAVLSMIGIEAVGRTPMTVTLKKQGSYAIVVAPEGKAPRIVGTKASFDFLVLLNVFNLFLGVPVDILTGAWFDLGPESVFVRFGK